MSNLNPCPFCGHTPLDLDDAIHPTGIRWREDDGIRHYIEHADPRDGTECWAVNCLQHEGGCGARMSGDSEEEVIAKWNTRTAAELKAAGLVRGVTVSVEDADTLLTALYDPENVKALQVAAATRRLRTAIEQAEPKSVQEFFRAPAAVKERIGKEIADRAAERQAHSKSEYKRLKTQGVDVLPPTAITQEKKP